MAFSHLKITFEVTVVDEGELVERLPHSRVTVLADSVYDAMEALINVHSGKLRHLRQGWT